MQFYKIKLLNLIPSIFYLSLWPTISSGFGPKLHRHTNHMGAMGIGIILKLISSTL